MSQEFIREWQKECLDVLSRLFQSGRRGLVVATPGAGKTRLALIFARELVRQGLIDHVHIVVPTRPLLRQWQKAAAEVGIQVGRRANAKLRERQFAFDVGGVVCTYAQISQDADAHLANMLDRRCLVIIDECHHAADNKAWGDAITEAFDGSARFMLFLSGTPFRDDNHKISMLNYTPDGVSMPDYDYGYGRAIEDDVCRPVVFRPYDALIAYKNRGESFQTTFSDDMPQDQVSVVLRHALHPDAGLVAQMVRDADEEVLALRSRGSRWCDAAALLVCMSIEHAYACAKVVKEITNEEPMVVCANEESSHDNIEAFRNGMGRWIIAVKMISEGVDIPRLMVSVYATTTTATLFFRQFVGRTVRVRHRGMEEASTIFFPADPRLLEEAESIEAEVQRFLKDAAPEKFRAARGPTMRQRGFTQIPSVRDIEQQGAIYRNQTLTEQQLSDAENYRSIFPNGERLAAAQIAYAVMKIQEKASNVER